MIAAMPGAGYAALRRRQYVSAFTIAGAVLAVLLIVSWLSAGPAANAVVIAALDTLAASALLQFYSTGPYAQSWPPLRLWSATFVGDATFDDARRLDNRARRRVPDGNELLSLSLRLRRSCG